MELEPKGLQARILFYLFALQTLVVSVIVSIIGGARPFCTSHASAICFSISLMVADIAMFNKQRFEITRLII